MSTFCQMCVLLAGVLALGKCFFPPQTLSAQLATERMCRIACASLGSPCPSECLPIKLDPYSKRSLRVNRGRNFIGSGSDSGINSFDDYLFMRLLGRNFGEP
ncbi:uncharacterized protein LOC129921832 [Biomphalaria glabrata]|uniref:Uncharacterized protein LOC129921832 n=1 Tax=Biomphalaria glabrata TaxID=6526 RepID=A0A9W2YDU3_BIOGL|nr:uncharacterized protein LOC129921832 [Biomphalaria glabrata]